MTGPKPKCWVCGAPAVWVVDGDWLCSACREKYYSQDDSPTDETPPTRRKRKNPIREAAK